MPNHSKPERCADLCSPTRNRYFYGKLLGVHDFELEQSYFNRKRWLLNRLVTGYGVVCGLGVQLGADGHSVVVQSGLAIDKCGREIIVCEPSPPYSLPKPSEESSGAPPETGRQPGVDVTSRGPRNGGKMGDPCTPNLGDLYLLTICFHECQTDPVPALGGDCDTQAQCRPGAIRESYKLEIKKGGLCWPHTKSIIANAISSSGVDYPTLVKYVSELCPPAGDECCIPLANIHIPKPSEPEGNITIDINVRPIVYTNDLLYQLILAMNKGQSNESMPTAK
jgi:hypothetical protein